MRQSKHRLGRTRAGVEFETQVNSRTPAPRTRAAAFVKPHQEFRPDRFRNNFLLKILADDAPICKQIWLRKKPGLDQIQRRSSHADRAPSL